MKNLSIRIDEKLLDKLHVMSDYYERSANGEVIMLIKEAIQKFETEHGEIK